MKRMSTRRAGVSSAPNSGIWKKYVSEEELFQYTPPRSEPYIASLGARTTTTGHSDDVSIAVREASQTPAVLSL